ncbi:MAG: putative lipid II flippase FtsW [Clostridiales bacterium]|nr:putative lipid II flippase FtsW [Clostridiales bacterium]
MKLKKLNFKGEYLLIFSIVAILALFGCVMVYSASFYSAQHHYGNSEFFLFKQLFGFILGICGLIFFSMVDYHILAKLKWWIVVGTCVLLSLVFIPGLGVEIYGAKRWISLLGFSIQPSEVAKFALVIFTASYLADNNHKVKTLKGLFPVLVVGGVMALLIMLEPSMSVTMCICFVLLCMLIIGGMSKKHTLMFSIPAGLAVPLLIIAEPYRMKRLLAFIDPWASPQGEGFQLIQSLYSLGDGGWFGVGLFNSRQKYLFLPFAESDFILSIMGEEIGFVGVVLYLSFVLFLCLQIIKIGLNAKDRFGSMLSCGVAFVIAVQTLLNVAVVTGSIPPTGLPLPFISAGSTSLLVFMSAIGVVLNVDRQSRKGRI